MDQKKQPEIDVIFDAETIAARIENLAKDIADQLPDDVLIIVVLKGSFVFAADLLRALDRAGMRPTVDFITLSSYGTAVESSGTVNLSRDLSEDVRGRTVMIIDDILDTGRTLAFATDLMTAPFHQRRAVLESMADGFAPPIHLAPMTRDRDLAMEWFHTFEGAGLDGLIAKPIDGTYRPDKRVQFKLKHVRTIDCVVAGYRIHKSGDGVGSLVLGLHDADGRLQHVGVAASFTAKRRAELVDELADVVLEDIADHVFPVWTRRDAKELIQSWDGTAVDEHWAHVDGQDHYFASGKELREFLFTDKPLTHG